MANPNCLELGLSPAIQRHSILSEISGRSDADPLIWRCVRNLTLFQFTQRFRGTVPIGRLPMYGKGSRSRVDGQSYAERETSKFGDDAMNLHIDTFDYDQSIQSACSLRCRMGIFGSAIEIAINHQQPCFHLKGDIRMHSSAETVEAFSWVGGPRPISEFRGLYA